MPTLTWPAAIAALVLAVVLTWAAVAKLRANAETIEDFSSLGLPAARPLSIAVPVAELFIAGLLVVVPGWGGVVAFALLAGFTTLLISVIRSGRVARCACFGQRSSAAVDGRHVGRNLVLIGLAALAATFDGPITALVAG